MSWVKAAQAVKSSEQAMEELIKQLAMANAQAVAVQQETNRLLVEQLAGLQKAVT